MSRPGLASQAGACMVQGLAVQSRHGPNAAWAPQSSFSRSPVGLAGTSRHPGGVLRSRGPVVLGRHAAVAVHAVHRSVEELQGVGGEEQPLITFSGLLQQAGLDAEQPLQACQQARDSTLAPHQDWLGVASQEAAGNQLHGDDRAIMAVRMAGWVVQKAALLHTYSNQLLCLLWQMSPLCTFGFPHSLAPTD